MDCERKAPLLVLNVQINECEAESIIIYALPETDTKIDLFCRNYHITDRDIIKKLKARLRLTLKEKYPFLGAKDGKLSTAALAKLKSFSKAKNEGLALPNKRKKKINTCVNKTGIQSLVYSKKTEAQVLQRPILIDRTMNNKSTSHASYIHGKQLFKKYTGRKENVQARRPATQLIDKYKPAEDTIMGNEAHSSYLMSAYNNNFNGSVLTHGGLIAQVATPQPVKTGLYGFEHVELESEAARHLSNYSQPRASRKASLVEHNALDLRKSVLCSNRIALRESRVNNEVLESEHMSIQSFNKSTAVRNQNEQLRDIYEKLDANGSGIVGPRNMNLRNLTADDLKRIQAVVIELCRMDPDAVMTFKQFCELARESG